MSFTRRQFLLSTVGAAGGFILPSFYSRALEFVDQFGEPLLEPPQRVVDELVICSEFADGELNLGDPREQLPVLTWHEFLTRYDPGSLDELEDWDLEESQLDEETPWYTVAEFWCRVDSPNARAYRLLENLDLGPDLTGSNAVGGLVFTDCPAPGNNYLGVAVEDEISISLLQQRLNDLETGIKIRYD
jgi:hypothetical protein